MFKVLQLGIFPFFFTMGLIRVICGSTRMISTLNIISIILSISTIIYSCENTYKKQIGIGKINFLRSMQILIIVISAIIVPINIHLDFISNCWSDFISIIALGIALSNEVFTVLLKSILDKF